MASGGKSVAVMSMPPPAAPPNFEKYRDAANDRPDSTATEAEAAEGVEGGVDAESSGENSADPKVSAVEVIDAAELN